MSDNDSSYDDESQENEIQRHHHQSQSMFSQRFGAITKQFPSAFKKAVSRERITTNDNDQHQEYHHEKVNL